MRGAAREEHSPVAGESWLPLQSDRFDVPVELVRQMPIGVKAVEPGSRRRRRECHVGLVHVVQLGAARSDELGELGKPSQGKSMS